MARIGFLGTGEIAESMVHGLAGLDHEIVVSKRSVERSTALSSKYLNVSVADNQDVLDRSSIVILGLIKHAALSVLPKLVFSEHQKVISVMVDVDLQSLQTCCAPASDISITIPLPFIATGGCPLPVFPNTGSVAEVFGQRNSVIPVASEKSLNAHFAATAFASVIFDQARIVSQWLGQNSGDSPQDHIAAQSYVVGLLAGYSTSLPADGKMRLEQALEGLSTQGGLNATLRAHMESNEVLTTLMQGLNSFKPRLNL